MNGNSDIPFLDLVSPHRELKRELTELFERALDTAGFIGGPLVEQFETSFAEFCDTKYCVGVSSGTDALRLALMAAGVKAGDAVITVANSFIATAEAISQAGALPKFVDIEERTYNMDPKKVREYLENCCAYDERLGVMIDTKTRKPVTALVPVHLYGQTADMDAFLELAQQYKLVVIEDACQAHGAQYFSRKENRWHVAGSMGKAAAFSFYPGKNLGACGEAGAITTNDEGIAMKARMLRDHGQAKKYYHDVEGYNGRLDAIQAGILAVKLEHLREWNEKRRENAIHYNELFLSLSRRVVTPYEPSWVRAAYHLYVIRVENRDDLRIQLHQSRIGTGIHYPIALHLQKAYKNLGYQVGDLPITEKLAAEILSLPMYPHLRREQQERVVQVVVGSAKAPAVSEYA